MIIHDLTVLPCELVIKFSDYFHLMPNKLGNWNCGFTIFDNKYYFLCRNEVSKYNEDYYNRKLESWGQRHVPVLAVFDENYVIKDVRTVTKSENRILSDVRIFNFQNELYSTGTFRNNKIHPDGKRKVDQFFAKIIDNKLIFLPFIHDLELPQKNWTPIRADRIYWENWEQKGYPSRNIMTTRAGEIKSIYSHLTKNQIRGNCQSVDFGDYFLTVGHWNKKRYYWHYFLLVEKYFPFNIVKVSRPFRFALGNNENERIQFIMGIEIESENLLISYGVQDSDNYLVSVKLDDVIKLYEY